VVCRRGERKVVMSKEGGEKKKGLAKGWFSGGKKKKGRGTSSFGRLSDPKKKPSRGKREKKEGRKKSARRRHEMNEPAAGEEKIPVEKRGEGKEGCLLP